MHVHQQIAEAVATRLRDIPELEGRVYKRGAIGWDFTSFPFAVVRAGETKCSTEPSSRGLRTGRRQDQTTAFQVVVEDLVTQDDVDYVERLSDLAISIERALAGFGPDLEDFVKTADTGVTDIESDFEGIHSGLVLSFTATYRTIEGRPDELR